MTTLTVRPGVSTALNYLDQPIVYGMSDGVCLATVNPGEFETRVEGFSVGIGVDADLLAPGAEFLLVTGDESEREWLSRGQYEVSGFARGCGWSMRKPGRLTCADPGDVAIFDGERIGWLVKDIAHKFVEVSE